MSGAARPRAEGPEFFTVNQLAEELGVTARAIRFYEAKGLIAPRRAGTTRVFDRRERAVLAYTDALVLEGGRVPDAVFDELKRNLSDEEILELTYITALYDMHAVMSRALRLEYDDVDERIVEIPAPHGGTGDAMRMVDSPED